MVWIHHGVNLAVANFMVGLKNGTSTVWLAGVQRKRPRSCSAGDWGTTGACPMWTNKAIEHSESNCHLRRGDNDENIILELCFKDRAWAYALRLPSKLSCCSAVSKLRCREKLTQRRCHSQFGRCICGYYTSHRAHII
jgi:hypothetical protein